MEKPYTCPSCNGVKKIDNKECPTCGGSGVVWKVVSPKVGDSFTKEAACLK